MAVRKVLSLFFLALLVCILNDVTGKQWILLLAHQNFDSDAAAVVVAVVVVLSEPLMMSL